MKTQDEFKLCVITVDDMDTLRYNASGMYSAETIARTVGVATVVAASLPGELHFIMFFLLPNLWAGPYKAP